MPACEMPRAERKITMKKTDRKMLKGGKRESMFMFSLVGSGVSKACWLGDALREEGTRIEVLLLRGVWKIQVGSF